MEEHLVLSLQLQSCDGFTALPTDILGTEHYVIGWENSGSYAASMIGESVMDLKPNTTSKSESVSL